MSAVQSLTSGDWGGCGGGGSRPACPGITVVVRLQLSWVWWGLEGGEGVSAVSDSGSVQSLTSVADSCCTPSAPRGVGRRQSPLVRAWKWWRGPRCSLPNARFSWEEPRGISGAAVGG